MKQLKADFKELVGVIGESDNREDLIMALNKSLFHGMVETDPEKAKTLIDTFKGQLQYNNFLTKEEAITIVSRMVFDDSNKTGKAPWEPDELFDEMSHIEFESPVTSDELIDHNNMALCLPGYFNKWALYVTMCKYYADNYHAFNKWVKTSDLTRPCYDFAVEQLMDQDKPRWVRWYFGL